LAMVFRDLRVGSGSMESCFELVLVECAWEEMVEVMEAVGAADVLVAFVRAAG